MNKRIPIIIVSGFLGSGKTTFLRYLLKNSNKKFGLLINEFGDVGIDGDLVKNHLSCDNSSDKCVIELNNGCICCTVQDDFIPSLKTLLNQNVDIELIIIETSGLALPLPLLKALNWPEIRSSVYLDLVIGIVNGESMLNGSPINNLDEISSQFEDTQIIEHKTSINDLFEEQLEVSDIVLISRSDLLTNGEFINIKKEVLKKINPSIPVIKCLNGEINLNYIFDSNLQKQNLQKFIKDENNNEHNHDHNHVELFSSSYKSNYFLDKNEFEIEMKEILRDLKFLRIKGRVWIPNKLIPLQVQIVGSKVNTWFEESPLDCWKPKYGGGLELIMIGFEEDSFKLLEKKITEKFNVLNVPN
tara:strand:+ start:1942 stop:3015 length:1074 start_codon:yes stop_codon:yes gene_type:complete